MSFENLLVENREGVLWITINRPSKLNALNGATIADLQRVMDQAEDDSQVLGVVVTGAGDRAFVAGADIQELNTLTPMEAKEFALRGQALFFRLERLSKPVIAAVNGFALGGGCELAMACHIRLASESAVFGQPEVKLGLIPGYGGTQRLPRLIGKGRALEIILSGRNVKADEAERIGLVNAVYPAEELESQVDKIMASMLANGPLAVSHCIEAVQYGMEMSLANGCLLEATLFGVGAGSEEMNEGTTAFLEKRKANFRGKE